jgi:hypothetical protein
MSSAEPGTFDVFICHASEDKAVVASPLAAELRRRGTRVWIDETELMIGDSLRRAIDSGLTKCRFGVVILSPSFFKKEWTQWELDGLAQREMIGGRRLILPGNPERFVSLMASFDQYYAATHPGLFG